MSALLGPKPVRFPMPPARGAALDALRGVLDRGHDVQQALDVSIRGAHMCTQDVALCTELVYGYLRSEIRVSWLIRRFLRSTSRLPAGYLRILGVAAYEILYLQRVPAYASVNWAVEYVRGRFSAGLAGLANAVLRNIERLGEAPRHAHWYQEALVGEDEPRVTFLSIWYAMPEWIVRLWLQAYGEDRTLHYLAASAKAPATGVRINMRHAKGPLMYQRLAEHPECLARGTSGLLFPSASKPEGLQELYEEGIASTQSFAVQEVMDVLRPEAWAGPVWDCCCGRGGKTCAMLERGVAVCAASDPSKKRLKGLAAEIERLGLPDVPVFTGPASHVPPGIAPRAVVADVPCSGFGTFARRPDIRYHRSQASVEELVAVQARILESAWSVLPIEGVLAYITCTLNPDENEQQIARFMHQADAIQECEWSTPPESPAGEFFYAALLRKRHRP